MKLLFLFLLLGGSAFGVTKEVVRVFQPVSYHDTDSASEYGVKGELVQAAVVARPMVVSGAFPEDLAKVVAMPCRLSSNNPAYEVEEANLMILCGLGLEVSREGEIFRVVLDCTGFQIPELVELSPFQVLSMTVESIRRTMGIYYQHDEHESFECQLILKGLNNDMKHLKKLDVVFQVGPEQPAVKSGE